MSAINGDKARFHRKRKDRIARRARNRERLATVVAQAKGSVVPGFSTKEALK